MQMFWSVVCATRLSLCVRKTPSSSLCLVCVKRHRLVLCVRKTQISSLCEKNTEKFSVSCLCQKSPGQRRCLITTDLIYHHSLNIYSKSVGRFGYTQQLYTSAFSNADEVCQKNPYEVATISRLLRIIGLFYRIWSLSHGSFAHLHRAMQMWYGVATIVGSLKLEVSFAKQPYQRDVCSAKRPIILRSLLIVATPHAIRIPSNSDVCIQNTLLIYGIYSMSGVRLDQQLQIRSNSCRLDQLT